MDDWFSCDVLVFTVYFDPIFSYDVVLQHESCPVEVMGIPGCCWGLRQCFCWAGCGLARLAHSDRLDWPPATSSARRPNRGGGSFGLSAGELLELPSSLGLIMMNSISCLKCLCCCLPKDGYLYPHVASFSVCQLAFLSRPGYVQNVGFLVS
jgi:hypothetical protein